MWTTPMKTTLRTLLGALATALAMPALAQSPSTTLRSLPTKIQKSIEETRASCREQGVREESIYDDAGVMRFTLPNGVEAVVVNEGEICGGERIKGANCATGGCEVTVYARLGNAWRKVLAGRGDPFIVADWSRDPPALRLIVVSLYGDAPECPMRAANVRAYGPTAWKQGQCDVIARWDRTKFTYRILQ
jgi:hypothetical protein